MKLSEKHHLAITLLATGLNSKETAEQIGVTPEAISRWKADFAFKAKLNTLLKGAQEEAQNKLRYLSSLALSTLEEIIQDIDLPAKDRLNASIKVLELMNVKAGVIGSTNASVLKSEKEQSELLESYNL
jgi:transcriptional regulator with XRE-family HTH domain